MLPVHDNVVLFPQQATPLYVGRPATVRALEAALRADRQVFVVAQCDERYTEEDPPPEALYRVGTVCRVLQVVPVPDGAMRVVVEGLHRAQVITYRQDEGYTRAECAPLAIVIVGDSAQTGIEIRALSRRIKESFEEAAELGKTLGPEVLGHVLGIDDPERLLNAVAPQIVAEVADKQRLLETLDLRAALLQLRFLLEREIDILRVERDIESQVRREVSDSQREFILRERLKAIQEELGTADDDIGRIQRAIESGGLTAEARDKALKELARLQHVPPSSPESVVIRTYLELLCELPWDRRTEDSLDITRAERILDEDHHGLGDVKERVIEFLAVRQLTPRAKGPILCFVGPPGVGKTSIGRSIARAMGRKFVRISLGGIRDEAEIRGHRRTYIGSMPGRIISTLRQLGVKNPVFMLDEVDKIGADFRGDPAAALLEALDPEQNDQFSDHYLEVRFDLSEVMFLLTANLLDTVPPALLDRMEVIEFPGYIEDEKLAIARGYLIPKQLEAHGLDPTQLQIRDSALQALIRRYTREAGVRNLDRMLARVCRKVAREVAAGRVTRRRVSAAQLEALVGPARFSEGPEQEAADPVGVAKGLAFTSVGGSVLAIEVGVMPGTGELLLTGRLGEVMKESAQAALTYVRGRAAELGITVDFKQCDIHIHVPEGATPKDGPSAGIALATALASALSGRPVRRDVAMTGEVTLRGRVLAVGGVREKLLAAFRNRMARVILPEENRSDVRDVPRRVRRQIDLKFARHMDEVLGWALVDGGVLDQLTTG